jgi:cyclophilin family peptidyl-prolyl cis-trans isomerase
MMERFSRVVHNFVIQGGDAEAKGITVPTILDELPNKAQQHKRISGHGENQPAKLRE